MKSEPGLSVPFIQPHGVSPTVRSAAALASLALASLAFATAGANGALAKPLASRPKGGGLDTETSVVTVTASRTIPQVQSTFPSSGTKVAPGLLVLRVTYDTRMRPEGWSYARDEGADYPDCAKSPRLLDDKRSFVLICRTLPGKRYAVWFNRPPLDDFSSFGRRPATPFELKFATTDDEPVRTLTEAMKADPALSNLGNPVEPDGLATYGQGEPPGEP